MAKTSVMVSACTEELNTRLLVNVVMALKNKLDDRTKKDDKGNIIKSPKPKLDFQVKVSTDQGIQQLFYKKNKAVDISSRKILEKLKKYCFSNSCEYSVIKQNQNEKDTFYFLFSYLEKDKFLRILDDLEIFYKAEFNKSEREKIRKARREARKKREKRSEINE